MGKTYKERDRRLDYYDEGRGGKRKGYRRGSKHSWKQYENTSADEVYDTYEHEDDMVRDD